MEQPPEKIEVPALARTVKPAGLVLSGSLVFEDGFGNIVHQHGFKSPVLFGAESAAAWLNTLLEQIDDQLHEAGVSERGSA